MNENQRQEIAARLTDLAMVEIEAIRREAKEEYHSILEIIVYQTRLECDASVRATLTNCGIHLDAGIRKAISAAILGTVPARGEDSKPEAGDIVAWKRIDDGQVSVTSCYNKDQEPLHPRSFKRVVLMRAAEVKLRIEATHG